MTLADLAAEELDRSSPAQGFAYAVLRAAILRSVLPPGTPLKHRDIASQLGVSHTPVRDAIRLLASRGLVSVSPSGDPSVAPLSIAEAGELFAIRIILEPAALQTALPKMNARILVEADYVLSISDRETDPDVWSGLNSRFHTLLYSASGFPRLGSMIAEAAAEASRYVRLYAGDANLRAASQREHALLLDACRKEQERLAMDILTTHLTNARDRLVRRLKTERPAGRG